MGLSASQARLLTLNNRMLDLGFEAQITTEKKIRLAMKSSEISQNLSNSLSDKVFINNTSDKEITANMLTGFQTMGANEPQSILKSSNNQIVVSKDTANKFENSNGNFETFINQFGYTSVDPDSPTGTGTGSTNEPPAMAPITQNSINNSTAPSLAEIENYIDIYTDYQEIYYQALEGEREANHNLEIYLGSPHTPENNQMIYNARQELDLCVQNRITAQRHLEHALDGITREYANLFHFYENLSQTCSDNNINSSGISSTFSSFYDLVNQISERLIEYVNAIETVQLAYENLNEKAELYGVTHYGALYGLAGPEEQQYAQAAYDEYQMAMYNVMSSETALNTASSNFFNMLPALNNNIQNLNTAFIQAYQASTSDANEETTTPQQNNNGVYEYIPGRVPYYRNIFNEMLKGYVSIEDEKFNDARWLYEQISSGNLHIEKYSQNSNNGQGGFIQTSPDQETNIYEENYEKNDAAAQAEYDRKKAELNYQEQRLDMKLKNIETEYSASKEELDSIKKMQEKNIDRSFKIFG